LFLKIQTEIHEQYLLYYLDYCCNISCCQQLTVDAKDTLEEEENNPNDENPPGYLHYGYGTVHLLTIILIALLAIAMICQHFLSFKKARKILPLLKLASSGPFATTRVDQSGIILPMVAYKNNSKEDRNKNTHIISEVLNPAELLTIANLSDGDDKIIDEDILEDKESAEYLSSNIQISTVGGELQDLSISIPQPLSPAYHPGRMVTQVWDGRHQVEQLYRYTSFDRLVYPPGYIT
jgi:hypothetical protein